MEHVTFRRATSNDLDAMFLLDRLCFTSAFLFSRRTLLRLVQEAGSLGLVAESGASLVGFILLQRADTNPSELYISTLDVDPAHRRQGIGGELISRSESIAADSGASAMSLHVWTENQGAIGFYQSRLYRQIGRHASYYGEGKDAFLYRKSLSPR